MNTGVQCIYHVYELTHYFLEDKHTKIMDGHEFSRKDGMFLGSKGEFTKEWGRLVKKMTKSKGAVKPKDLKAYLGKYN